MPDMHQLLAQLLIPSHLVARGSSRGITGVKIGDFDRCHCPFMTNSHDTDTVHRMCSAFAL